MRNLFKSLFSKNKPSETASLSHEGILWNTFIEDVCNRDVSTLTSIQKTAVLVFWYDAEMGSGGYSGYFDCYKTANHQELSKALEVVNASAYAINLEKAILSGREDDYEESDRVYNQLNPPLGDLLMKYIQTHKEEILKVTN